MSLLEGSEWPALGLEPFGVPLRPGFLRRGKAPAVAEQEFGEAVAGAQEIDANVFATAEEIARGLFLFCRDVNRGQGAGAIEDGELAGIAAIGFDPVAGTPRNECWGDDIAGGAVRGERPLQLEATRAGLVAALHGTVTAKTVDEAQDRWNVRRQRMERRRPLTRE